MDPCEVRFQVYLNKALIMVLIIHQIRWATRVIVFTFAFTKVGSLI